jgi:hypothetical protein
LHHRERDEDAYAKHLARQRNRVEVDDEFDEDRDADDSLEQRSDEVAVARGRSCDSVGDEHNRRAHEPVDGRLERGRVPEARFLRGVHEERRVGERRSEQEHESWVERDTSDVEGGAADASRIVVRRPAASSACEG